MPFTSKVVRYYTGWQQTTSDSLTAACSGKALASFRAEVRRFIRERLPADIRHRLQHGLPPRRQDLVRWQRILHERGWAAPNWPPEHGGAGLGVPQQLVLIDELARASAPQPLVFNVSMLGPVLLKFGTGEQQRELLPRLASLELWCCQGFSEPEAGSDLAALRTRAVRDGDSYVVEGRKIWTTGAHNADLMFALVRTAAAPARRQDGMSFLLIDMHGPGVVVRPIYTLDGMHHVNEVLLDRVRVPAANLVGAEGEGWSIARYLLEHERTAIVNVGQCRERLEHARMLAARVSLGATSMLEDPGVRLEIVRLDAEVLALERSTWRLLGEAQQVPAHAPSVLKLKGVELYQDIMALLARIAGPPGVERVPLHDGPPAEWYAALVPRYFHSRATSIAGGSSEVQKEILARLELGAA